MIPAWGQHPDRYIHRHRHRHRHTDTDTDTDTDTYTKYVLFFGRGIF